MVALNSPLIGGPLAAALEKNRETLNARIAALRLDGQRLDRDALSEVLGSDVAPAVEVLHPIDEAAAERAALALFQLTVELLAASVIGPNARTPSIATAWRELLPLSPKLLRLEPRRFAGAIVNAVSHLESFVPAAGERWIERMRAVMSELSSLDDFLRCGRIVAWRCGLAHLRSGALEDLATLTPALCDASFGMKDAKGTLPSLREDRWLDPANREAPRTPRIVATLGRFRGFGGSFLVPPTVGTAGDHLIVTCGDARWTLHADRFGATLVPVRGELSVRKTTKKRSDVVDDFPELIEPSGVVESGETIAVTLRYSHSVYVIGPAA
jgi:hypothetical protein